MLGMRPAAVGMLTGRGVLGRDVPVGTRSTWVLRAATDEYVLGDPEVEGVVLVARASSVVVLEDAAAVASSLESDCTSLFSTDALSGEMKPELKVSA